MEVATARDAEWFARHAHRRHRVRPALRGEFGPGNDPDVPPGCRAYVVVRQVFPGMRVRLAFTMRAEPSGREAAARTLFNLIMDADPDPHTVGMRNHA
jgi:hypothetical protein